MKKLLRIIILVIALGMYFILITNSDHMIGAIFKIISVALLLVGMESVRRKGDKLYRKSSDIHIIDDMDSNKFREYIAQLYKKLGYYIQPNPNYKKLDYDFIIRKDRQFSIIKCFVSSQMITLAEVHPIVEMMEKNHKKSGLFVTNRNFEQDALEYLTDKNIEYVERRDLIKLIEQIIGEEHLPQKTTKVQET